MIKSNLIYKAVIFAILLGVALMIVWQRSAVNSDETPNPTPTSTSSNQKNESPEIISTKPDPLEEAVISATEEIEITFSHPLENEGQFKVRIEPKVDYKIVLSGDRKTAKIIPQIPYELGAGYTLFILPDSKFDGIGEWKKEKIFHFQTIRYRGV